KVPRRELDLLAVCGEIISGVVLVAGLLERGLAASFLTGWQAGIITDDHFGDARILRVEPKRIRQLLERNIIPVVAGFQGMTEAGEITTLGRGGSDTTASALGVALNAEYIDIYTDVDGIMTADPRIVDKAKLLDVVTFNEICQLAQEGAKVIHPRAVEIAMQKNIPIWVKNTFSEHPGTLVTGNQEAQGNNGVKRERMITGIAHIAGITQVKVVLAQENGITEQYKIFHAMAEAGISVDFINADPQMVAFTVKDDLAEKAYSILANLGYQVYLTPGCAKVAVVGAGMTGIPGVMAAIARALYREQINILQSADSYTSIWVLVKNQDMERAIRALHTEFYLDQ
ncbi:aspartate kinase, partial [Carboxydocella sp. JDF658]